MVNGCPRAPVLYIDADMTVPRYPWLPPPRLDGTEAAFCFNLWQRRVRELYVGWPATLLGWIGKLLVEALVDGTEDAIVVVLTAVVWYSNVKHSKN